MQYVLRQDEEKYIFYSRERAAEEDMKCSFALWLKSIVDGRIEYPDIDQFENTKQFSLFVELMTRLFFNSRKESEYSISRKSM